MCDSSVEATATGQATFLFSPITCKCFKSVVALSLCLEENFVDLLTCELASAFEEPVQCSFQCAMLHVKENAVYIQIR